MRFSLRQLEVFAAVCRSGGVNAAALELSMTQSAASQALAELESALDGPLFDRVGRRLRRNERGDQLYPAAAELLARSAEIEAALRGRGQSPLPPRLTLAASATIGSYLLPPILGRFLGEHPDAHVDLRVLNTEQVIAEVAAFRADAGFIEGSCSHPELLSSRWREDELVIIAAPGHPLARRRKLAPEHFAAERWILREPGSGTRETFERAAADRLPPLARVLSLGHSEAVQRAVMSGAGLGCLSRLAVAGALARGELKALKTPFLDLHRQLHRLVHRHKYQTAGLRAVLAACERR